jgi:hypothetical protein
LSLIVILVLLGCAADVSPTGAGGDERHPVGPLTPDNEEANVLAVEGASIQHLLHSSEIPSTVDFFPLGLYEVRSSDYFDEIKAAGFNMVHMYHPAQSLAEAEAYLDAAEAAGLKVRQNMPTDYLYAGDEFWIQWVTTLSSYDALAFWYLPEEPIFRGYDHASMVRLYEIAHQYDPQQRPVTTYFATLFSLQHWCDAVDVMMVGCYPEWMEQPRACMKTWVDLTRAACPSQVVIGVPPFFDTNEFGRPGGYPSPHEARFDAYTALIAGARGLDWFYHPAHEYLPEVWRELQEMTSEMDDLGPVLLSPDAPQTVTVDVVSGPAKSPRVYDQYVYDSIQILQSGAYLLASNLATDTVVAEFGGFSPSVVAVHVLYEEGDEQRPTTIPISAGSFRDRFDGLDVHIYRAAASTVYMPFVMRDSTLLSTYPR